MRIDDAAIYLATKFGYAFVFKHREGVLTADPGDEDRYRRDYWRDTAKHVFEVLTWDEDGNGIPLNEADADEWDGAIAEVEQRVRAAITGYFTGDEWMWMHPALDVDELTKRVVGALR